MDSVVVEKKSYCFGYVLFVGRVAFGVADGPPDEHGGSIADVARDYSFGQRRLAEMSQSCVD